MLVVQRKPMATPTQIIDLYERTGHLRYPNGVAVDDVPAVGAAGYPATLDDPRVERAKGSYQQMFPVEGMAGSDYLGLLLDSHVAGGRCGCPDYPLPPMEAQGQGPWKGCHGFPDQHTVSIHFTNSPPDHLMQPYGDGTVWDEIVLRCQKADAEMGLRLLVTIPGQTPHEPVQIKSTFVRSGSGWIGLALIGNDRLGCTADQLWARFVETYLRDADVETIITFWTILLLHEWGHNRGFGHRPRGIMNAGILRLLATWLGDPHEADMRRKFSGVPIDDPDPPPPPPPPPKSWLRRLIEWFLALFQ